MTRTVRRRHQLSGLDTQRRAENFPVALRVLPRRFRDPLVAAYEVARTIDDLGDRADGDRSTMLAEFDHELRASWAGGEPSHPVLRRNLGMLRGACLDPEPFHRLVRANLLDQTTVRYSTFTALRGYCALSAEPIGRLVLDVFQVTDRAALRLSDQVCTALQLVEHWQDVAEDRRAGRVYLPRVDLERFGVGEHELDAASASPALRRLLAFEVDRAARLLDAGPVLVARLGGWARLAIAGYVAGGQATVAALRRADLDVLATRVRPDRVETLRRLGLLLVTGSGGAS